MFRTLKEDLDAVMERDPAARSRAEVFFLYSGSRRCAPIGRRTGVTGTT